jgi:glycosyltransferase involved in cell wall biosynthesis
MTETDTGLREERSRREDVAVPDLSVVIPSVNGSHDLLDCLDALLAQEGGVRLEILVPERCGTAVREAVRDRFPGVRLIPVPPATSIPEMRRLAFQAATADSVAVIEDHVLTPPDWARSLVAAREEGHRVIGGSVVNAATERLVDRAAFLCEYGHMLRPQAPGPAPWLTGNNVVYDRRLLRDYAGVISEGGWEDRLHAALLEGGVQLVARPDIRVGHCMRYRGPLDYASQRFHYSRAYAGLRAARMSWAARAAYGVGTALLPPVLLGRIVVRGWAHAPARADLFRSLPLLVLFVVAWALGETAGALAGPGHALARVR